MEKQKTSISFAGGLKGKVGKVMFILFSTILYVLVKKHINILISLNFVYRILTKLSHQWDISQVKLNMGYFTLKTITYAFGL